MSPSPVLYKDAGHGGLEDERQHVRIHDNAPAVAHSPADQQESVICHVRLTAKVWQLLQTLECLPHNGGKQLPCNKALWFSGSAMIYQRRLNCTAMLYEHSYRQTDVHSRSVRLHLDTQSRHAAAAPTYLLESLVLCI